MCYVPTCELPRARQTAHIPALVTLLTILAPAGATGEQVSSFEPSSCGPLQRVTTAEGHIDYRFRDVSPVVQKGIRDLDHYHTTLAIDDMRLGSLGYNVVANLNFTLRHCPNHHVALQTLIQFDRGGGKVGTFPSVECYLYWAREFAPDDPAVRILGGYYFWKAGDLAAAKSWYLKAIEIEPTSADAHYNLGLLYLETSDYEQALEQAQVAYSRGYPLPGLRDKLKQAGRWRETVEIGVPAKDESPD